MNEVTDNELKQLLDQLEKEVKREQRKLIFYIILGSLTLLGIGIGIGYSIH